MQKVFFMEESDRSHIALLSVVAIVAITGLFLSTGDRTAYTNAPVYSDEVTDGSDDITGQVALSRASNTTPPIPYGVPAMNASNFTNCNDTDRGNFPLVAGTVRASPPTRIYTDICVTAYRLTEYYCAKMPGTSPPRLAVWNQQYTCTRGCVGYPARCN